MATTVTYKGQTLTTVENQTRVLETAGTWLEDDITLVDSTSGDGGSGAVNVTEETAAGGGVIKHITAVDISDTTAQASDVASGEVFYTADGTRTVGTASGGGGSDDRRYWKRPSEFPDLDQIDLTGQEAVYITYRTNTENSYAAIKVTGKETLTFDIGTLEGGVFTVKSTDTYTSSPINYTKWLTGYEEDYVILRISGNITGLQFYENLTVNGEIFKGLSQYCVEVYGRLPHLTTMRQAFRYQLFIRSVKLIDMTSVTSLERVAGDSTTESFFISGITNAVTGYYAFAGCKRLTYLYLNETRINNIQQLVNSPIRYTDLEQCKVVVANGSANCVIGGAMVDELDLSSWNVTTNNVSSAFQNACKLKKVNISTWNITGGSGAYMFQNTQIESIPECDYSKINNTSFMFSGSMLVGSVTMPVTADTQFRTAFQYCSAVRSITIPASYTGQIVAQAFRNTDRLEEIHFLATTPPPLANKNAFNYGATKSDRKIFVPYSADHSVLEAYQTASVWSTIDYPIVEEEPE